VSVAGVVDAVETEFGALVVMFDAVAPLVIAVSVPLSGDILRVAVGDSVRVAEGVIDWLALAVDVESSPLAPAGNAVPR
jgi:hypothetical protein